MNRETMRLHHQRIKKMSTKDFKNEMDILHSRAYELAAKHFTEAMEIELQPKQRMAVLERAKKIREEWDGINEVTVEVTEDKNQADLFDYVKEETA